MTDNEWDGSSDQRIPEGIAVEIAFLSTDI